jgi:hypothetical protein
MFEESVCCYITIETVGRRFGFMPFWFFPILEHIGGCHVKRPMTSWGERVDNECFAVTIRRKTNKHLTMINDLRNELEE